MPRLLRVLVPVLAALAVGCGGGGPAGVKVSGRLVHNGKPLSPAPKEDDTVEVALFPDDASQNAVPALYHADGRLEFVGATGGGVPPGPYRVLIRWVPYQGDQEDRFQERFTPAATPLRYTVSADPEQDIVVDVGKRTVTAGK